MVSLSSTPQAKRFKKVREAAQSPEEPQVRIDFVGCFLTSFVHSCFIQPGKLTKTEMKTVFGQLVEADKVMRARLQVIQVACETGWKTAKNLAAVHSGDFILKNLH